MPVLIIGTYRDVDLEVQRPFAKMLETMTRQRQALKIALSRLPEARVAEMLAARGGPDPPAALVRAVYRETEGNPFFVEEVFQHLDEEGRLRDAEGVWKADLEVDELEVPEGVRLVIGRRVDRLAETTRKLLTTAAVVGRSFDLPLLTVLGGDDEDDVLTALEEAESAQLIRTISSGREVRWEFAHGLIRQTLEGALSLPRRQRAHLGVADALEQAHGESADRHAADLGHHLFQAGAAADADRTVRYLTQAGDQALDAGAFDEAARQFDAALALREGGDPVEVVALHERNARALRSGGRAEAAVVEWRSALGLFEQIGDTAGLVRAMDGLGFTLAWSAGDAGIDEAWSISQRLLRSMDAADPGRAQILAFAAFMASGRGDSAAGSMLDEAAALAEQQDDPVLLARVLSGRASYCWQFMLMREGTEAGLRAAELLRSAGDPWALARLPVADRGVSI